MPICRVGQTKRCPDESVTWIKRLICNNVWTKTFNRATCQTDLRLLSPARKFSPHLIYIPALFELAGKREICSIRSALPQYCHTLSAAIKWIGQKGGGHWASSSWKKENFDICNKLHELNRYIQNTLDILAKNRFILSIDKKKQVVFGLITREFITIKLFVRDWWIIKAIAVLIVFLRLQ